MRRTLYIFSAAVLAVLYSASWVNAQDKLFRALKPSESGIDFINFVPDTSYMITNAYMYSVNGGGTAVADFNNDGLQDVAYLSNYGEVSVYVNKGNLKFEKVKETGIIADDWCTALIAGDVNGDGLTDLYVCKTAFEAGKTSRNNLLYINKGGLKFEEQAKAWGVDNDGNSTGAVFFDFDLDGDLDLFVVNGPHVNIKRLTFITQPTNRFFGTDALFENVGGRMVDVTDKMGIREENAFGLSVVAADLNADGWPDLYVANDFIYEDFIYISRQGKGFDLRSKDMMPHTSFFSMGSDVNDFNNDALPDIVSVDMLHDDLHKFKWEGTINTYDFYENLFDVGGHNQYIRNCLQLNRGDGTFSEIAELAGVAGTDWSWTCLFADLDNDGWKDLYISNGIRYKANIDYIQYESEQMRAKRKADEQPQSYQPKPGESFGPTIGKSRINLQEYPKEVIANFVFRNNRDLTFSSVRDEWGMAEVVNSNGSSYADLDNDGDLEMIVNNHNDTSVIYRNFSREKNGGNFIQFKPKGELLNSDLLGTKIFLYAGGIVQYQEIMRTRGFQSSSQAFAHFGLGNVSQIDSVVAVSPYGQKKILLINPKVNQTHFLDFSKAVGLYKPSAPKARYFIESDIATSVPYRHVENLYQDFKREPLLTHQYSRLGPGIAVADANNDGLEDIYIGGASGQSGVLWLQKDNGAFIQAADQPWSAHSEQEDMGALFFDVDNDGDLDLYVVSGGNEELPDEGHYKDRLYINQGQGKFFHDERQLSGVDASGSCVVGADFDGDGDIDLFVGGRILTGQYPVPPRSYLLRNDGGTLVDVTTQVSPELAHVGLVTSALWTDFDDDGDWDLFVVGQWMPVSVFENRSGKFVNITQRLGLSNTTGWWNSITGADLDDDGDTDYVLGNLGLNTRLKASENEPLSIYASDFDKNMSWDALTFMYYGGVNQPIHRYIKVTDQLNVFRRKFLKVKNYAYADLDKVIPPDIRAEAYSATAKQLASCILVNEGKGNFVLMKLPNPAQFAPVYGLQVGDFNFDGNLDLLLIGNMFGFEIETGRSDAFRGQLLLGDGKLGFEPVEPAISGFRVAGDGKSLSVIRSVNDKPKYFAAQNNDSLKSFELLMSAKINWRPQSGVSSALLKFDERKTRKIEFYVGDGYLSQNSGFHLLHKDPINVRPLIRHFPIGTK